MEDLNKKENNLPQRINKNLNEYEEDEANEEYAKKYYHPQ
jgi:hypothetical protein